MPHQMALGAVSRQERGFAHGRALVSVLLFPLTGGFLYN
ncbi:hypothetical protein yrohd0001_5690 [Yersinia rohdei ATCC 43380]|nr:hypothetical protein yrohd0001_5690 [Yersinia rohdei ATCC 43380]